MSDLQTIPVDELLTIATRYSVHVRLIEPDHLEVRPPAGATPIERVVAARLRQRVAEITAALTIPQHLRPRREAA